MANPTVAFTDPGDRWTILKELKGGIYQPVYLCRDNNNGGLVVCKLLVNPGQASASFQGLGQNKVQPDVEEEVENYRNLFRLKASGSLHPNLVDILEVVDNFPNQGDTIIVLGLCNGGTLTTALTLPTWIPNAFILHVLSQGIDGLQYLRNNGTSHGDCHTQNVFLDFPNRFSVQEPRAIIHTNTANDYPNAVLADYGTWVHTKYSRASGFNKLGHDLEKFCYSVLYNVIKNDYKQEPIEDIKYWLERFTLDDMKFIAPPLLSNLLSQFWNGFSTYETLAGPKTLTPELAIYFDRASRDLISVANNEAQLDWYNQNIGQKGGGNAGNIGNIGNMGGGNATDSVEYQGGGEGSAAEVPDVALADDAFLASCERFYVLDQDDEYRFGFPGHAAINGFTQARRFYWIAAIATRRARSAATEYEQDGRFEAHFDRIVRNLDISLQCQTRGKASLTTALQHETEEAPTEDGRRNWRRVEQVMWGAPTRKRLRVSSYFPGLSQL